MASEELDDEIVEEEDVSTPEAVKRLREKLRQAVKEKQEYLEGWQRSRADFVNYKRDEAQIHTEKEERLKVDLAEALIPTLDAFEAALGDPALAQGDSKWKKGMDAVYQGLQAALRRIGIDTYWPEKGSVFDPYTQEALREVPTEVETEDHTIEETQRAGYSIAKRIIRPAQVSVRTYSK